jgi:hypothetical protein
MWFPRPAAVVLAVLMVGCAAARADDVRKPAEEPDLGFLEFLGSVDRLSDVNPDYIAQAEARAKAATANPPAKPPPARPPAPPPNAANGPGGQKNE